MYSLTGKIKGSIKGNQVVIEMQVVQDPNFQNLAISGTLTLSDDRKSLIASFAVQNNNTRDECTATYLKMPTKVSALSTKKYGELFFLFLSLSPLWKMSILLYPALSLKQK